MKPKYNKKQTASKKPNHNGKPNKSTSRENNNTRASEHVSGNINDPSYYFNNPVLMEQLTRISFNDFMGIADTLQAQDFTETLSVPYFMRINLNPSPGFTTAETEGSLGNALNLAALELYTTLSANNGRTSSYAPQDIATLLLAIGDIVAMSSYITRIFGTAYLFNQRNRAYPKEMIEAQGVDYDDLMQNFANYRARFNAMLTAQSEIPFPANVAYFTKCAELYSGLYVDDPNTAMAATYAFVPESVWILDDTSSEQGTMLGTVNLWTTSNKAPMSDLLTIFDQMLGAVNTSASVTNNIYADILRLAEKGTIATYKFAIVPDDYVVLPAYVPEVALWINNMTIMGQPMLSPDEDHTQSNNVYHSVADNKIVYKPQFQWRDSQVHALYPTMNFPSDNVTAPDIVSATRLMAAVTSNYVSDEGGRVVTTDIVALPDHYVTRALIYTPTSVMELSRPAISTYSPGEICALTNFDYSPIMYMFSGADGTYFGVLGDVKFYTQTDFKYLSRLHDTAYLGLFEIR